MSTAAFALRYVAAANQLAPISSALWVEASDVNGRRAALIVGDLVRVGHETVAQSSQDRWIRAGIFTGRTAGEPADVVLPALPVKFQRLIGQSPVAEANDRLVPVWD